MRHASQAAQAKTELSVSPKSLQAVRLQRQCACGQHTVGGGQCAECSGKQRTLQRSAVTHSPASAAAPDVVHEALRSPGQPLDASTRSLMESRFGQDFSSVRVHTDTLASESAEAVSAHAYTLDRHILFGPGQYAPETTSGQRLLAHELTHVLQQTAASGAPIADAQAEHEAEQNSRRFVAGQPGRAASAARAGQLQRDEKKGTETEVKGERSVTKEGKEKFGFEAEVSVPLTNRLHLGSFSFLDNLKLTGEGGVVGSPLLSAGATPEELKLQMALTLAKLELANVKDKAEALKRGKLSFGTTLSTSGGPTFAFDPFNPTGSLGLSLAAKAGATTPSLIPSRRGKLTFGASLSAGGSLTQTFGDKGASTSKADANFGLTANFESAPSKNPALTLGGVLGDKAKVTADLEGSASGSLTSDKTSGTLSGGGSIGITGTRKDVETFVKLKLTGDATLDHKAGSATTNTQSIFIGLSTGFKF